MKTCGLYKITNTLNNKCYIGQSVNINKRLNSHKSYLKDNKHPNKYLQSVYNLDNKCLIFEPFFVCQKEDLSMYEKYYIKKFKAFWKDGGYNLTKGGEFCGREKGCIPWNRGLIGTQVAWNKGKPHTDETKLKMSLSKIGKKRAEFSEEQCKRMSACKSGNKNPNFGKPHSEEHRKRISYSMKGNKNPNYGKHLTEETKQKISNTIQKKRVKNAI